MTPHDDTETIAEVVRERDAALQALQVSAERLHDLSDEPIHQRNVFAECPHYACVEARRGLGVE